jgi:hypothetical protein
LTNDRQLLFPVNVNAWENGGFGPQIRAKPKFMVNIGARNRGNNSLDRDGQGRGA